jgi:hypothetical protein
MAKEEYIAFRTSPEIKQALQELAEQGYRTLSQQCEMIITEHLKKEGLVSTKTEKKPKK